MQHSSYIELRLEDSVDKIPKELQDCQTVVLDGFTNPIELQSFHKPKSQHGQRWGKKII